MQIPSGLSEANLALTSVERQRVHYDALADRYEAHYADDWSLRYRDRFFNARMVGGLDIRGWRVLDGMAGSGELSGYLLRQGADVTGLDISEGVLAKFREKFPRARAVRAPIAETGLPDESFDMVAVCGALHHCHPNLDAAVNEIHRLLKPGGWFVFMEPVAGSVADRARQLWYRLDPLFESNEEAVDIKALMAAHRDRFTFESLQYGGNVAYLLVFNSMVFRLPHALKRVVSPALMGLEAAIEKIQGPRTACMAVARWRKAVV